MHLPFRDIFAVLRNLNRIGKVGGTFVTNTDVRTTPRNRDIRRAGGFRPIDIKRPPFSIPRVQTTTWSSSQFELLETFRFPLDLRWFASGEVAKSSQALES